MFITVQRFDDEERTFVDHQIRIQNVNALNPEVKKLYGERGAHECVKVWMVGYFFWMNATDAPKMKAAIGSLEQ